MYPRENTKTLEYIKPNHSKQHSKPADLHGTNAATEAPL